MNNRNNDKLQLKKLDVVKLCSCSHFHNYLTSSFKLIQRRLNLALFERSLVESGSCRKSTVHHRKSDRLLSVNQSMRSFKGQVLIWSNRQCVHCNEMFVNETGLNQQL